MATKEITPTQYSKLKGCSLQNVTKAIRMGWKLDYVVKIKKFNRFYVLVVPQSLGKRSFKK